MTTRIVPYGESAWFCEVVATIDGREEVIFSGRPHAGPDAKRRAQKDGDWFTQEGDKEPKQGKLF